MVDSGIPMHDLISGMMGHLVITSSKKKGAKASFKALFETRPSKKGTGARSRRVLTQEGLGLPRGPKSH